ncbi:MAG: TrkA C-terminal domain-containing protein [Lentisphaeria bacterium]|jgi:MFS family permease
MIAIFSLLIVVTLSLLVTRIAAAALMLTGISQEMARFQARSAYSGVGFTTSESEAIVNHPVRRRIVMLLMLLGNLGVATVVATIVASVLKTASTERWWWNLALLAAGLLALWGLAASPWVEGRLNRLILSGLRRWTRLEVKDYVAILQLQKGYAVSELKVEAGDWLAEKSLREAALTAEGVLVLGIARGNGDYLGAPHGDHQIQAGATLILYALVDRLPELDQRPAGAAGDQAHQEAMRRHRQEMAPPPPPPEAPT